MQAPWEEPEEEMTVCCSGWVQPEKQSTVKGSIKEQSRDWI